MLAATSRRRAALAYPAAKRALLGALLRAHADDRVLVVRLSRDPEARRETDAPIALGEGWTLERGIPTLAWMGGAAELSVGPLGPGAHSLRVYVAAEGASRDLELWIENAGEVTVPGTAAVILPVRS